MIDEPPPTVLAAPCSRQHSCYGLQCLCMQCCSLVLAPRYSELLMQCNTLQCLCYIIFVFRMVSSWANRTGRDIFLRCVGVVSHDAMLDAKRHRIPLVAMAPGTTIGRMAAEWCFSCLSSPLLVVATSSSQDELGLPLEQVGLQLRLQPPASSFGRATQPAVHRGRRDRGGGGVKGSQPHQPPRLGAAPIICFIS